MAGHVRSAIHIGEAVRFDNPQLIKANLTYTRSCEIAVCPHWSMTDRSSYKAVVESMSRSGLATVVDSSKSGETLGVSGVRLVPIHLVKDLRASTWSWFRKREIISPSGKKENLKHASYFDFPIIIENNYKSFIKFLMRKYLLVEYGRFCGSLQTELKRILAETQLKVGGVATYRKESNHGVGGNAARYGFEGELRPENKWREEPSLFYRIVTTVAYAPLLLWTKAAVR